MALLNGAVERLEIPGETGEWVELRHIDRRERLQAADVLRKAGVEQMKEMGADLVVALRRDPIEDERQRHEREQAVAKDPLLNYDVDELLFLGLSAWSYPVELPPASKARERRQTIAKLDEETATWAARQILRLGGVVPEAEREAARKNA